MIPSFTPLGARACPRCGALVLPGGRWCGCGAELGPVVPSPSAAGDASPLVLICAACGCYVPERCTCAGVPHPSVSNPDLRFYGGSELEQPPGVRLVAWLEAPAGAPAPGIAPDGSAIWPSSGAGVDASPLEERDALPRASHDTSPAAAGDASPARRIDR